MHSSTPVTCPSCSSTSITETLHSWHCGSCGSTKESMKASKDALIFLLGVFEDINQLSNTHDEPHLFYKNVKNLLKRERPDSFLTVAKANGFVIPPN